MSDNSKEIKKNFFKKILNSVGLKTLFFICFIQPAHAQIGFHWPNNAKAAVSLSYDDALNSQLDNAVPALNEFNIKASFYITLSSDAFLNRINEWKTLPKNGHEIGNHSLFHQCEKLPEREWITPYKDLYKIDADQMLEEITVTNRVLASLLNTKVTTFTVPCGEYYASGKNYLEKIAPLFIGAKSEFDRKINDKQNFNPYHVSSIAMTDENIQEVYSALEQAKESGALVSIIFHGIEGEHLSISKKEHRRLLNYLNENKNIFYTDTFNAILLAAKNQ